MSRPRMFRKLTGAEKRDPRKITNSPLNSQAAEGMARGARSAERDGARDASRQLRAAAHLIRRGAN